MVVRDISSSSDSSEVDIEKAIATTGYFTYEEERRSLANAILGYCHFDFNILL